MLCDWKGILIHAVKWLEIELSVAETFFEWNVYLADTTGKYLNFQKLVNFVGTAQCNWLGGNLKFHLVTPKIQNFFFYNFMTRLVNFRFLNLCFSASSHFLKVELPEYLEHEPESSQTKQAISIADQSSESLTKYKQLEDENEIDIIYQDSESDQRDASEMGKHVMRFRRGGVGVHFNIYANVW